ncbi:hypothetical protein [Pedobacter nanyangensis]|uniref:hypothetical protein n=1 Tax=Pedobacter nanyangensis TaxID=1562389 RepID=UPI000DE4E881|nr:hypothetical protein [Pedobacter nanyangensis]
MKKTIIAFLLLQAAVSYGQTKEETVKYINSILSVSKGIKSIGGGNSLPNIFIVTSQSFSLEKIEQDTKRETFRETTLETENKYCSNVYTEIPWNMLGNITIKPRNANRFYGKSNSDVINKLKEVELVELRIEFNAGLLYSSKCDDVDKLVLKDITVYVVPEKAENIKKAFEHLKGLMKEKDLFGN